MARLADKMALITGGRAASDSQPRGSSFRRALACTSWASTGTSSTLRSRTWATSTRWPRSPTSPTSRRLCAPSRRASSARSLRRSLQQRRYQRSGRRDWRVPVGRVRTDPRGPRARRVSRPQARRAARSRRRKHHQVEAAFRPRPSRGHRFVGGLRRISPVAAGPRSRPWQETKSAYGERRDICPALHRPAEEGTADQAAVRGAARARRDQPAESPRWLGVRGRGAFRTRRWSARPWSGCGPAARAAWTGCYATSPERLARKFAYLALLARIAEFARYRDAGRSSS